MDLVFASHLILDTVKRTTSLNVPIISFSIQNLLGASYQGWVSKLSRMHGGVWTSNLLIPMQRPGDYLQIEFEPRTPLKK